MSLTSESGYLTSLNEAQREAVEHGGGPLIVLAGPGTGKTRVIVSRAAHLIAARGVEPGRVLALTFTIKAAEEMRERLAEAVGWGPAQQIWAGTFNSFGSMLVNRFSDLAGLPGNAQLIDSAQRRRLLRELAAEHGLFRDHAASGISSRLEVAQRHIGAMHCAGLLPEEAARRIDKRLGALTGILEPTTEQEAERQTLERWRGSVKLWKVQEAAMRSRGLISYDDQISWAIRLLREQAMARDICHADYTHIIVDEFQDLNLAQLEMLRLLAPPSASNPPDVCVVGDDDQSIYGFRGADDRGFERFRAIWGDGGRSGPCEVTEIRLTQNYRSQQPVLDTANAIINAAHRRFAEDKEIERPTELGSDASAVVQAVNLESHKQAGDVIATMIAEDRKKNPDRGWDAYAVIARTHGELSSIRAVLELDGIPLKIAKPRSPADDAGVQDVLAWVDLLLDPNALWAARRILRRPPFQIDADVVTSWEQTYRSERSRARAGDDDAPAFKEEQTYFGWLRDRLGGDERFGETVKQAGELFDELAKAASIETADKVFDEIVRRTGVAHRELLDGRARARRVRSLAALVRFVRDRLGRLEAPGDLRAYKSYFDDLDPSEQRYETPRDDAEPELDDESDGAGVSLLTAHASKGLEFDTVFVPRVESQWGYPSLRVRDGYEPMPEVLKDASVEVGTDAERLQDEERRLFYVACTRAERRLVILGNRPKSKPKSVNYFWELREIDGLLIERDAEEVFTSAEEAGAIARRGDELDQELVVHGGTGDAQKRRARIEAAQRASRLAVAGAIDALERGASDEKSFLEAMASIRGSVLDGVAVAIAKRGGELPAWIDLDRARALHGALSPDADADSEVPGLGLYAFRKGRAPLKISYTWIAEYEKCPRCFYFRRIEGVEEAAGTAQVVGQVVHGALFEHVSAIREAESEGVFPPGLDTLLKTADKLFFRACKERQTEADGSQRDQIHAQLRAIADGLVPPSESPELLEHWTEMPYERDGATHRVVAKIDRLDRMESTPGHVRIIDYKTGYPTKERLEPSEKDLQLGLYAMLARHELETRHGHEGPLEGLAEYWFLQTNERGSIAIEALAEKEDAIRKKVDKTIDGVMAGEFPRVERGCWGLCTQVLGEA